MNNFPDIIASNLLLYLNLIEHAHTLVIIGHKNPDIDALSSSLAMFFYLLAMGKDEKQIEIVFPEYNEKFNFIPGFNKITKEPQKDHYDLLIAVDFSNKVRIQPKEILNIVSNTLIIDHHEYSQEKIFSNNIINDPDFPSCTSLIYETFPNPNDKRYLTCIATGLISDTANLTLNSSDKAKKLISQLQEDYLVDIDSIVTNIFKITKRDNELINILESRKKIFFKNGCSTLYSYLTQDDLLPYEYSLVNLNHKLLFYHFQKNYNNIHNIIFAFENNKSEIKISMRSSFDIIDFSKVCEKLLEKNLITKGGGHSFSASCTFKFDKNLINSQQGLLKIVEDNFQIVFKEF